MSVPLTRKRGALVHEALGYVSCAHGTLSFFGGHAWPALDLTRQPARVTGTPAAKAGHPRRRSRPRAKSPPETAPKAWPFRGCRVLDAHSSLGVLTPNPVDQLTRESLPCISGSSERLRFTVTGAGVLLGAAVGSWNRFGAYRIFR